MPNSKLQPIWTALVVLGAVVLPRLAALGDFPHMDDGYHAFMAQYIQHSYAVGNGFPAEMSGFKLFPVLFHWVWALPGNAMSWLRLADLLAAALAAWLFCIMLVRESRNTTMGLLLSFAFLVGLNLPGAIDSGFKNSFSPAFACFFLAVNLVRNADSRSFRWFWGGVLAAIGVLFRETFFFFPLLGCFALVCAKDVQALWRFILGGVVGALTITAISALYRGQFLAIFDFYLEYGKIYGPEAGRRWHKFLSNGVKALTVYWPLIILTILALVACIKSRKPITKRGLFWLAAAVLPLLEPMLKIGFLYHFSVCLPGMAGFCAWAYSVLPKPDGVARKVGIYGSALAACCMAPLLIGHFAKLPLTLAIMNNYPNQGWPAHLEQQSTTLEASRKIHELLPANGTVSSSGFAYFIFPASQTLPPALNLGDLSRTYIYSDYDPDRFRQKLAKAPPDLILVGKAIGDHSAIFEPELRAILEADPAYSKVDEVPQDMNKDYGWLGYTIYKRGSEPPKPH